jgi:hypothetical protein
MPETEDPIKIACDKEASSYQRRRGVKEMAKLPVADVLDALGALLSDEDMYLRREVITSLAQLPAASVVPVLIKALEDTDDYIRRDAARVLGEIGDSRAVKPLQALLKDDSHLIRSIAKTGLALVEQRQSKEGESAVPEIAPSTDLTSAEETAEERTTDTSSLEQAITTGKVLTAARPYPAETAVVTIPRGYSWQQGRRFQLFFTDDVTSVQALYDQLSNDQSRLLELEHSLASISRQLSLQRADKDDDLAELDEVISTTESTLGKLERELSRTRDNKTSEEAKLQSFWYRLIGFVWPSKKENISQQIATLEDKTCELGKSIETDLKELADAQQRHDELSDPIKTLQANVEELTTEKDALIASIRIADSEIDGQIVHMIRTLLPEHLRQRIGQLGPHVSNPSFLATCAAGLTSNLVKTASITSKIDTLRVDLKEASASLQMSLDNLGGGIASGFEVRSSDKRASVRLTGSVSFKQEHTFFGGYSGASGTASGSGSGEGHYTVEEIAWEAPGELRENVTAFAEASVLLGEKTAELEAMTARRSAHERSISDYAHLIRTELERDFEEV